MRAGRSGHGVKLTLRKKIPAGAGLGGGSADAAAALLAVRRMLDIDIDDDGLRDVGAALGSDVPFCLGGGAAWLRGRGEQVEPVDLPIGMPFLVALPPFRLSTPDVYRAWDNLGRPRSTRVVPAIGSGRGGDLRAHERSRARGREARAATRRVPSRPRGGGGSPALMAGSGSAYVVPVDDDRDLAAYARRVSRRLRLPVTPASNVSRGVRVG